METKRIECEAGVDYVSSVPWRQRLGRWFRRTTLEAVPVASCVHFTGFRYGVRGPHPYEEYLRVVSDGGSRIMARDRFESFLSTYRPVNLGEALGVKTSRAIPLWCFPWIPCHPATGSPPGWTEDPAGMPDIITHFSPTGIVRYRVDEEVFWLERAWWRMGSHGYHPQRHAPIRVQPLEATNGRKAHLVLDGNHRLAALAALGHGEVLVECVATIFEAKANAWEAVVSGACLEEDARAVFSAYLLSSGNRQTTGPSAPFLDRCP